MTCGKRGTCLCTNSYDSTTDSDYIEVMCHLTDDLMWPAFAGRIRSWIKMTIDIEDKLVSSSDISVLKRRMDQLHGYFGKILLTGQHACQLADDLGRDDLVMCDHKVSSNGFIFCRFFYWGQTQDFRKRGAYAFARRSTD